MNRNVPERGEHLEPSERSVAESRRSRISVRALLALVALVAMFLGGFKARSAAGVFAACVLCLASYRVWQGSSRSDNGLAVSRMRLARSMGSSLVISFMLIGLADFTFLAVYALYRVMSLPVTSDGPHFLSGISSFGIIYGTVLAVVVARFLRIVFWSGSNRASLWKQLAFVLWMFLGVAIVGLFTSFIREY
jgi:hypothetical protein